MQLSRRQFTKMVGAAAALSGKPAHATAVDLHYFLSIGQSLDQGHLGNPALSTVQPFANTTVSGTTFTALTANTVDSSVVVEDPVVAFMNTLTSLSGGAGAYDGVVYRSGAGSAGYNSLKKGTSNYNAALTNAGLMPTAASMAGKTYEFTGALCVHGETDSSLTAGSVYKTDLETWRSDYQTDLYAISSQTGNDFKFFLDQTFSWNGGVHGMAVPLTDFDNTPNAAQAQWWAMRDNPGLFYLVCPLFIFPYADGIHLTNAGYRRLGEYAGLWAYRAIVQGYRWSGLPPRRITRDGAVITCQFWVQPGRSLVIDTTTLSSKGNGKGFEFTDNSGNTPAISSVSVSGDAALITLASTPTGGNQRLQNAYGATLNAGGGTSGQAHTNIRDDDPALGPYSGAHMYNWAHMFDEPIGFSWLETGRLFSGGIGSGFLR